MKRTSLVLCSILLGLVVLFPFGMALLSYFGYTFAPSSMPAFATIVAALSVSVVVLDIIHKDTIKNKAICVLLFMIMPISLINVFIYLLKYRHLLVLLSGGVCVFCCSYLTIKYAKPLALKIVALILSALLVIPVAFFYLLAVVFPIGQNTVVQTVESPSGKYYAQVIDSDQGALGGDTLVDVYENWEINLLLFKIEKKPKQVYLGEWGEFRTMRIKWRDDSCLLINSIEYKIE